MKYLITTALTFFILSGCNNNPSNEDQENEVTVTANSSDEMDSLTRKTDESVSRLERDIEKTRMEVDQLLKDIE